MPIATSRKPLRTSGAAPTRNTVRSWIQAPVVHAIVPAVRAMPDRATLSPRIVVTVSGTKMSGAKKAKVSNPRDSTAAGSAPLALNAQREPDHDERRRKEQIARLQSGEGEAGPRGDADGIQQDAPGDTLGISG